MLSNNPSKTHIIWPMSLTRIRSLFRFKKDVSSYFNIHPSQIVMVGSAKLGFSISPHKRYREFGDTSDIDLAIISKELFDNVSDSLLDYLDNNPAWDKKRLIHRISLRGMD